MTKIQLKRCTRCLLPETHETIFFDDEGVCNICLGQQHKSVIDWEARKEELQKLADTYVGRGDYDCIVPFSGGKDSTFTLYYLVCELNLRPLVVTFDHSFLRSGLIKNRERTLRKLGCDFLSFTPNWKIVRVLMLQSLIEKGDFCWHCHTGIFAYPMWIALEKRIPLIIWGEPSAEYTAYYSYSDEEEVDEARFDRYVNLGLSASDMLVRIGGDITARDLKPFTYPPRRELQNLGVRSICLGSFIPWDTQKQSNLITRELGWEPTEVEGVPPQYGYEKIECWMQGVRDYIKFLKRGYSRPSHLAALDLRNGRIDLPSAAHMIDEWEGRRPASLDLFLEYVGITEAEFNEIVEKHAIDPWVRPKVYGISKKPNDFGDWQKREGVPREKVDELLRTRWAAL